MESSLKLETSLGVALGTSLSWYRRETEAKEENKACCLANWTQSWTGPWPPPQGGAAMTPLLYGMSLPEYRRNRQGPGTDRAQVRGTCKKEAGKRWEGSEGQGSWSGPVEGIQSGLFPM